MTNQEQIGIIDKKILLKKEELENIKGTVTEIYARITGYFRAVGKDSWNPGKMSEYNDRKTFEINRKYLCLKEMKNE
ncbi:MAG TPA: anaerobic ribonucleoside-triphosphate reductase [Candidatus Lokiarchaeia archaeon]